MTLAEFHTQLRNRADLFLSYYRQRQLNLGWPDSFDPEEWDEQYEVWLSVEDPSYGD